MSRPTTILTGFLGAGKTTYLNHLLTHNPDKKYAIIENEYGEESIDSELILRAEDGIMELNNGCLCCTLNDNLYEILNTLYERQNEYDEVIIEATGVADPAGLAQPFIMHPAIKKAFPLKGITCLVDAEFIEDHIEDSKEALQQIVYSDALLINKIDLVDEAYLFELKTRLQKLNPLAHIYLGKKEDYPPIGDGIKNVNLDKIEKMSHKDEGHGGDHNHDHHTCDHSHGHTHGHNPEEETFPVKLPHSHHHHDHTEDLNTLTFSFDQPFSFQKLQYSLLVYITFQAKDLYRMKGLIWLDDNDKQHVIQSVRTRVDLSERSPSVIASEGEKRVSTVVFIGKNIQRKGLEKMLSDCLA